MKQALALAAVLVVAGVALYYAQHRRHADAVSSNAMVDMAADWQHDISRVPLRVTRISDEKEQIIGDELARQYELEESAKGPEERATEHYIDSIGKRVASHAQRKSLWRFHLIADRNLINAFALPGGHIFVGQGLLDRITSEDELAFVLGHEIEHVDHYHAVERVQIESKLKDLNLDAVAEIAQIPITLWQIGYSKDEEMEADREGLRLSAAAGYSATGAVNLLERWSQLRREYVIHADNPTDELSQLAIDSLRGYFRSHPLPSERLAQANEVIAHDHLSTDQPLKPFRVEYEITAGQR